jgi:hypothetical protein
LKLKYNILDFRIQERFASKVLLKRSTLRWAAVIDEFGFEGTSLGKGGGCKTQILFHLVLSAEETEGQKPTCED